MSEIKMNPTLRELARCVAALNERRGPVTPFLSFQRDTYRDTLREKTSIRYLYLVPTLTAKRVRSRVDSHACGARWWDRLRFPISASTTTGCGEPRKESMRFPIHCLYWGESLANSRRIARVQDAVIGCAFPITYSDWARCFTQKPYRYTPLTTRKDP